MARKVFSDREIGKYWLEAWRDSPGTNPYSGKIDRALREHGLTVHDVKTRVGIIRGKRQEDRLDTEQGLLDFADSLVFSAEQALVDKCTESTQGSIFLLESKYGYRKGQEIRISADTDTVKTVRTWGSAASTETAPEGESKAQEAV